MSAPLLHRILTREECDEFSALLEAKYLARHNLGTEVPPSVGTADAGSPLPDKPGLSRDSLDADLANNRWNSPDDDCAECDNHRVTLNPADCVITPCQVCRPRDYETFVERTAARDTIPCAPPDPWDVPEEDQNRTVNLRSADRGIFGDRREYDPCDDKADLQPFERLTGHGR